MKSSTLKRKLRQGALVFHANVLLGEEISNMCATRASLEGGELTLHFCNVHFDGLRALKTLFTACRFESCTFQAAVLKECVFENCTFKFCTFKGRATDISSAFQCSFDHCIFDNIDFRGSTFKKSEFVRSLFDSVDFTGCDLSAVSFHGNSFSWMEVRGAKINLNCSEMIGFILTYYGYKSGARLALARQFEFGTAKLTGKGPLQQWAVRTLARHTSKEQKGLLPAPAKRRKEEKLEALIEKVVRRINKK